MAKPQIEDGYIKVAKELATAFSRINLSAYESRVLWCVFNKTYGWSKKTDRISYSQFVEATGLAHQHIGRTLKKLVERKILTCSGTGQNLEYGIQKDYEIWQQTSTQTGTSKPVPNEVPVNPENQYLFRTQPVPIQDATSTQTGTETSTSLGTHNNNKHITITSYKRKDEPTKETFDEYLNNLKPRFRDINFDEEFEKYNLYWGSEKRKKPVNKKLTLFNWMTNARKFQQRDDNLHNPKKDGQSGQQKKDAMEPPDKIPGLTIEDFGK